MTYKSDGQVSSRMDGTGYPDCLKRDEIFLEARIIADVVDTCIRVVEGGNQI